MLFKKWNIDIDRRYIYFFENIAIKIFLNIDKSIVIRFWEISILMKYQIEFNILNTVAMDSKVWTLETEFCKTDVLVTQALELKLNWG